MVQSRHRSLIEASFLTTIMVVLFLASYYQPIFFFFSFVWAVPLAVLIARQGIRYGVMSLICTMAILGLYTSYLVWPMVIPILAVNFFIGWGLNRDWKPFKLWSSITVVGILGIVFSIYISLYAAGLTDYHTWYPKLMEFSREYTEEMYDMGILGSNLSEVQARSELMMKQMLMALPAGLILAGITYAAISYYVAGLILKRLGFVRKNTLPPLYTWKFSVFFAYLYGFSMLGYYWGDEINMPWLSVVSINTMELANIVGFLQAVALIAFFRHLGKISKKIIIVIAVLCLINPWLLNILALVGYFDMIFDYRKKIKQATE